MSIQNSSQLLNDNLVSLRKEIDKLGKLNQIKQINDKELEETVNKVFRLSEIVLLEYSKNQSLNEIADLTIEMKKKIHAAIELLDKTGTNLSSLQILFSSRITNKTQKSVSSKKIDFEKESSIKEKEFITNLSSSLKKLEKKLEDIETFDLVVENFSKNVSFPQKLSIYKSKFFNGLFNFILKHSSKLIYYGHKTQFSLSKSKKNLIKLNNEKKNLKKKFSNIKKLKNKEKFEIEKEKIIKKKLENKEKIERLKEKITDLEQELNLGKETRKNLHSIGGTNIKIKMPHEDVVLDGTYLSSDSFRETLKNAEVKSCKWSIEGIEGIDRISFQGLLFPSQSKDGIIDMALTSLGAYSSPTEIGAGWQKIFLEDGSIAILNDEDVEKLQEIGIIQNNHFSQSDKWKTKIETEEINTNPSETAGTVIITTGNVGVYEMHKREILGFLMRGLNVMAFNFRGYGESQGKPSEAGINRDIEAAFQYVKQKHNVPDDKIILKALCMSGGPTSELASRHPDVNLLIDQSYANFSDLAKDQIDFYINKFVEENEAKKSVLSSLKAWAAKNFALIVHAAAKLLIPSWSVEKEIGKVKGHVGILLTKNDVLIKVDEHVKKNYQSVLKGKKAKSVTIMAMEGEHSASWVKARSKTIKFDDDEEAAKKAQEMRKANNKLEQNDVWRYKFENIAIDVKNFEKGHKLKENIVKVFMDDLANDLKKLKSSNKKISLKLIHEYLKKALEEKQIPEVLHPYFTRFALIAFEKNDFLLNSFYSVKAYLKENNIVNPKQIVEYLESYLNKLPVEIKEPVKEFFSQTIHIPENFAIDPKLHKEWFDGRLQMDIFLNKTKLTNPFIPKVQFDYRLRK